VPEEAPIFVRAPFRVATIAVAASAAIVIAGAVALWWELGSNAWRGRTNALHAIDEGSCFLLGEDDRPFVDPATGFLVLEPQGYRTSDREYERAWNDTLRARLAAGDVCSPRWLDRVATRDEVRERFRRGAARVVPIPRDQETKVGGRDVLFTRGEIRIGNPELGEPRSYEHGMNRGGRLGDFEHASATALPSDDGRTIFIHVQAADGADMDWFVFDAESGTLLYRFAGGS
jgi:hypothetical protein